MTNVLTLMRQWSDLPAPSLDDLVGTWRAEFVPPLRHIAPVGLGLIGLPRWYGKRFEWAGDDLVGVNLLRARTADGFEQRLPMCVAMGVSAADHHRLAAVAYAVDSPRPWRWIRDELRAGNDGLLVGMSYLNVPGLRRFGLPFRLVRVT